MPRHQYKTSLRRMRCTEKNTSWKDHPIVVATVAIVGTSVFFMTVIVPLRVEILSLKLERLTEISSSAVKTAEHLEQVVVDLAKAKATINLLTAKSPFANKTVYPAGYERVVLGTTADDVIKYMPGGEWGERGAYYSYRPRNLNAVITGAAYYFDEKNGKRIVTSILFHLDGLHDDASGETVEQQLKANFGEPNEFRGRNMVWKATDREWVVLRAHWKMKVRTYEVYASGNTSAFRDIFDQ